MWWFIVTFVIGIAIGRFRLVPSSIRRRPQWIVTPALICLLFLLGAQIGGSKSIWRALPTLGWRALVIAVFSMAGSALVVLLSSLIRAQFQRTNRARGNKPS